MGRDLSCHIIYFQGSARLPDERSCNEYYPSRVTSVRPDLQRIAQPVGQVERKTDLRTDKRHCAAYFLCNSSFDTSTTQSGSKPNFFCNSLSGADAPNVFIPITRPDCPT